MWTSVNVATPFTQFTVVCPESVPPPGFAPIVNVMGPVKDSMTPPPSLRASTLIGGEMAAPDGVLLGCWVNARWVGPGGGGGGGVGVGGSLVEGGGLGLCGA